MSASAGCARMQEAALERGRACACGEKKEDKTSVLKSLFYPMMPQTGLSMLVKSVSADGFSLGRERTDISLRTIYTVWVRAKEKVWNLKIVRLYKRRYLHSMGGMLRWMKCKDRHGERARVPRLHTLPYVPAIFTLPTRSWLLSVTVPSSPFINIHNMMALTTQPHSLISPPLNATLPRCAKVKRHQIKTLINYVATSPTFSRLTFPSLSVWWVSRLTAGSPQGSA